ncbi:MAG: methyltransferase domain-containing protein [Luteitalea sp.]|nr:methyltransferase domain-containing protein [Luteitalea sp.]
MTTARLPSPPHTSHRASRGLDACGSGLEQDADGVWTIAGVPTAGVSYPEAAADRLYEIEDRSFWFQHRNACILAALGRFPPEGPIFDIGGGNGVVAKAMQDHGLDVVLIEPGESAPRNARRRGVHVCVRARPEQLQVEPGVVGAVTLCDVLEHIDEHETFLDQIHRYLSPGGRLLLTVPAYGFLWSSEDVAAGHIRRYTLSGLSALLAHRGYTVEYGTYMFQALVIPIAMLRTLPSRLFGAPSERHRPTVTSSHVPRSRHMGLFVRAMLAREVRRIGAGRRLSWGASCLVVARKV